MNDKVGLLLAEGLWDQFEVALPDTPNRIVTTIFATLKRNGYTIVEIENPKPELPGKESKIKRCSGCGKQIYDLKSCFSCRIWASLRGKK